MLFLLLTEFMSSTIIYLLLYVYKNRRRMRRTKRRQKGALFASTWLPRLILTIIHFSLTGRNHRKRKPEGKIQRLNHSSHHHLEKGCENYFVHPWKIFILATRCYYVLHLLDDDILIFRSTFWIEWTVLFVSGII